MKASELRIGNLLYFKNTHDVAKVELIHNNHFDCRDEYGSFIPNGNYEPIPLTEEWLLKFGFKRHDKGSVSAQFSYGTNPVTQDYLIYLKWIKDYQSNYQLKGFPFYNNGHFEIKTVHQLQNLIHSLCGEELELKETLSK